MATATERRPANLSESSRKVRDPLGRLRGYIRTYVITESLTSLLLCLAICFWAGLLLDYGSFLLGIDWVRDLPRWLRASLLAAGLLTVSYFVELHKALIPPHDAKRASDVHGTDRKKIDAIIWTQLAVIGIFTVLWVRFAVVRDLEETSGLQGAAIIGGLLVLFAGLLIARRMLSGIYAAPLR